MAPFLVACSLVPAVALVAACGLEESGFGITSQDLDGGGVRPDAAPGQESGPGSRTIGGLVTGLQGRGLTLQNNEGDDLVVAEDGPFFFPVGLAKGSPYSVRVKPGGQPVEAYQECKVSAGSGTVGDANVLDVAVTCALLQSCKELKAAFPSLPSKAYVISPGHDIDANAYCDMTYAGGGWTLIEATTRTTGPDDLVAASANEEIVPGSAKYMSVGKMKHLAAISSQVHIRESGKPERSITSTPDTKPIANLRLGHIANRGLEGTTPAAQAALWAGMFANERVLRSGCTVADHDYPAIYWACANADGMHLVRQMSVWDYGGEGTATNIAMDVFLR